MASWVDVMNVMAEERVGIDDWGYEGLWAFCGYFFFGQSVWLMLGSVWVWDRGNPYERWNS